MTSVAITLPVFAVIAAGWLFRKYRVVDAVWVHVLNAFAYYVSLPALIVVSFWKLDFSEPRVYISVLASVGIMIAFMVLVLALAVLLPISRKQKAALFLVATTGNTIYLGLPLVTSSLGSRYLSYGALVATVYLVLPILVSIFVVRWWAHHEHSLRHQLVLFLKNPLTVASLIGVCISFIPKNGAALQVLESALAMIGATASPVALFALGGFLYKRFLKRRLALVAGFSLVKTIAFPALVLIVSSLVGIADTKNLLLLLAAMPVAVTTFVIAERFDLDTTLVGNSLLASTIISFFTIPLIIAYLF